MFTKKDLGNSKIEIQASVDADEFVLFFQQAVLEAQKNLELPGFRKGMVPEKRVIEEIGEDHIMLEAAEHVIARHWGHIIKEADIEPVGRPEVTITKLAKGNPLEFKLTISVLEKVEL